MQIQWIHRRKAHNKHMVSVAAIKISKKDAGKSSWPKILSPTGFCQWTLDSHLFKYKWGQYH